MSNKHRSFGIVLDEIQLQCTLWIIRQVERIHQAPFALQRIIGDFGTCHPHKPSLIRLQLRRAVWTTGFGFAAGCLIVAQQCTILICKNPPSKRNGGRQPTSATRSNSSSTRQECKVELELCGRLRGSSE